nr:hypothetical protein [Hyphomicrobium zavarzinii]
MAMHALVAISHRSRKAPVAVHGARPHSVDGLLTVLLALVLRDAGEKVLDQDGVGVLAELNRRALQDAAGTADRGTQFQVRLDPARKPRDVVDDDDDPLLALLRVLTQIREHRLHARARGQAAGHVILEDRYDLEPFVARILAATGFLGAETIAARRLLGARHTAIDDGLRVGWKLRLV